ncbi:MAG TPA: transcription antitermination factor NusB [Phycisphaerales bacterium]|nr:transcription antitermination factor NusB [Phycisphaerales bacterium]
MAQPRDIRRLAFQALYQLDARQGRDADEVRAWLDQDEEFRPAERDRAFALAAGAWEHRAEADAATAELAPDWPAHRQAAVDRTILRMAHYEMTRGGAPPKAIVNEAVELAKTFSTERSPAFVNALLDKILKRLAPAAPGHEGE